ncbi:hypothetical protein HETIRDRAFT_474219 [Heterobasidion irregulare TC 32-1]|uniref:DUF6534 domain-containing protein n=1 Tax=Heterobasidion irregulare (strain TC 32-1) TaxID=747525 RepID=W4KBG9_HETIT|nr:uncharacterized protein HETIRDRAFT_474219 [Heterobasidion irregulare TC 32-1]ETW83074.1 hypothetical protein HETIRDRAFT_474219 [Heterobasidion irregulare TC 32-1]
MSDAGATLAKLLHGPMLAGTFINAVLYGVSITQVYIYVKTFRTTDKQWIKGFIAVLFALDTINTVFDMAFMYDSVISHFGDVAYIQNANWIFCTDPALTGVIGVTVQLFFAWRVKILTGSTAASIVIALTAILQCLAGIATSIAVGFIPAYLEFRRFKPAVIVWLAGSAACDTMITIVLVWHLRRHKGGFSTTDDVIDRIIRVTVQTGMLTSLVALIDLVLFISSPSGLHLAFNFPLSKLYTNSLLSSLNSRKGWAFTSTSDQTASATADRRTKRVSSCQSR